jgi:hypothetical protein
MHFYTPQECEEWLKGRQRTKPDATPGLRHERIAYPKEPHSIYSFARWIAANLTYDQPSLLWITEWGIWPSSENWHLYYKLKEACEDRRQLHESPGHLFQKHESEDLASFLQLSMLNGWGGYLLTHANFVNLFFSHDEYMDLYAEQQERLTEVSKALT